jgi:hypothetical protein
VTPPALVPALPAERWAAASRLLPGPGRAAGAALPGTLSGPARLSPRRAAPPQDPHPHTDGHYVDPHAAVGSDEHWQHHEQDWHDADPHWHADQHDDAHHDAHWHQPEHHDEGGAHDAHWHAEHAADHHDPAIYEHHDAHWQDHDAHWNSPHADLLHGDEHAAAGHHEEQHAGEEHHYDPHAAHADHGGFHGHDEHQAAAHDIHAAHDAHAVHEEAHAAAGGAHHEEEAHHDVHHEHHELPHSGHQDHLEEAQDVMIPIPPVEPAGVYALVRSLPAALGRPAGRLASTRLPACPACLPAWPGLPGLPACLPPLIPGPPFPLPASQTAKDIDGHEVALSKYAGKVTLVVNVASACGYTDANYKVRCGPAASLGLVGPQHWLAGGCQLRALRCSACPCSQLTVLPAEQLGRPLR